VKSIRNGQDTIAESYADTKDARSGESTPNTPRIPVRPTASTMSRNARASCCAPGADQQADGGASIAGMTMITLKTYLQDAGGQAAAAVSKGKEVCTTKPRERKEGDWGREKGRLLRARG